MNWRSRCREFELDKIFDKCGLSEKHADRVLVCEGGIVVIIEEKSKAKLKGVSQLDSTARILLNDE